MGFTIQVHGLPASFHHELDGLCRSSLPVSRDTSSNFGIIPVNGMVRLMGACGQQCCFWDPPS